MTFFDTKVVVRMVVTHLRNPIEGVASGTRPLSTKDTSSISSASRNVAADSNQNKQVICALVLVFSHTVRVLRTYFCREFRDASSAVIY
jgi:hypothetical protein